MKKIITAITFILSLSTSAYEVTKKVESGKRETYNFVKTLISIDGILVLETRNIDYNKDGKYESYAHRFFNFNKKSNHMILGKLKLKKDKESTVYYSGSEKPTIFDGQKLFKKQEEIESLYFFNNWLTASA